MATKPPSIERLGRYTLTTADRLLIMNLIRRGAVALRLESEASGIPPGVRNVAAQVAEAGEAWADIIRQAPHIVVSREAL